jgi:hypothetical protein
MAAGHSGIRAVMRHLPDCRRETQWGAAITGVRLATDIDRRGRSDGRVKTCGRFRARTWPARTIVMCRARFLQKAEHPHNGSGHHGRRQPAADPQRA